MSGESVIALSNPLDEGNSANSVESAARGFDTLFGDVELETVNPEPKAAKASAKPSEPAPVNSDAGDDAATDGEGQSPDDDGLADPILDGTADDGDEDGEDGEQGDTEDGEDDGELDLDREVEVTVNGEVQNLPLKEVIAGYSRDADYRQKTARLAEERREVEDFARETVQTRQQLDAKIIEWDDHLKAIMPSDEDWKAVEDADPKTALAMRKQWDGLKAVVDKAKADREALQAQEAEQATREYMAWAQREDAALFEKVPALRNPKAATKFRDLVFSYGQRSGYSLEELKAAADHRHVLTLYKAARYDEIQAARKGKGLKAPSEPRSGATSSRPRAIAKGKGVADKRAQREAEGRLQRTGSVQDAAMAFTKMFG